jgi:hypothetical protein
MAAALILAALSSFTIAFAARGTVMISDKIRRHHLDRKAILYVRQSSAHQMRVT